MIVSAVPEVRNEVSVNKTGLSSKSSRQVKTLYVVNPRENTKIFSYCGYNIIVGFCNSYLDRNYREFPVVFTAKSDRVPPKRMERIL